MKHVVFLLNTKRVILKTRMSRKEDKAFAKLQKREILTLLGRKII